MMKVLLASPLFVSSFAIASEPCVAWDYSRLKDSTQQELIEHACTAQRNKTFNIKEQYALIANGLSQDADRVGQIKAVCADQVKASMSVHLKKFGKPLDIDGCESAKAETSGK